MSFTLHQGDCLDVLRKYTREDLLEIARHYKAEAKKLKGAL